MDLCFAFRRTIEKLELDKYPSPQFLNMVKDYCPLKSAEIFLWRAFVRENVLEQMLNIDSNVKSVQDFCLNLSYRTGIDCNQIKLILEPFWKGIIMSYYGSYPTLDTTSSIKNIYYDNLKKWTERIKAIESGLVLVKKDGYYGWLDCKGNEILPCKYRGATNFQEGLACVNDEPNYFGFINILGNPELDLRQHPIKEQDNLVTGVGPFCKGIAICDAFHNKEGYLNLAGKFSGAFYEKDSTRWSVTEDPFVVKKDGLYGLMNHSCELVIEPQFIEINEFKQNQNNIAAKYPNGEWVIVTRNGVIYKNKCHLIDLKKLRNGLFVGIYQFYHNFYYHVFNEVYKRIENLKIIKYFESASLPLLVLDENGKYYYINNGDIACDKHGYDFAYKFVNEFTWVKQGFLWARIDKDGKVHFKTIDFEVLSEEIGDKVLIRSYKEDSIFIFDCKTQAKALVTHNVHNVVISRCENYDRTHLIYKVTNSFNFYAIISNGIIFSGSNDIRRVLSNRKELVYITNNSLNYEVFFKDKIIGSFIPKNSTDKIMRIIANNENEFHILVKTLNGEMYFYSFEKRKYSKNYSSFDGLCLSRGALVVRQHNMKILLDSNYDEVFHADDVVVTANDKYLRFSQNEKWGLISQTGDIVLAPNFNSVRCQKNI